MRCDHSRSRSGLALVSVSSSPVRASWRPMVKPGVDPRLGGRQEQLLQAAGLGPGERLVAHLAVGRSSPEVLGLA